MSPCPWLTVRVTQTGALFISQKAAPSPTFFTKNTSGTEAMTTPSARLAFPLVTVPPPWIHTHTNKPGQKHRCPYSTGAGVTDESCRY